MQTSPFNSLNSMGGGDEFVATFGPNMFKTAATNN